MISYILIGNLCTGKTTLGKAIAEKLSIPLLSIDDYRIKHNPDAHFKGEFDAWYSLRNDIVNIKTQIIFESSGTSMWFEVLAEKIHGKKITIKLICDISVIRKRLKERKHQIPIPYNFDIEHSIAEIFKKIDNIKTDYTFDSTCLTVNEMLTMLNI